MESTTEDYIAILKGLNWEQVEKYCKTYQHKCTLPPPEENITAFTILSFTKGEIKPHSRYEEGKSGLDFEMELGSSFVATAWQAKKLIIIPTDVNAESSFYLSFATKQNRRQRQKLCDWAETHDTSAFYVFYVWNLEATTLSIYTAEADHPYFDFVDQKEVNKNFSKGRVSKLTPVRKKRNHKAELYNEALKYINEITAESVLLKLYPQ
eukprot:TRINITY_DN8517_c0_g1_i1.p1 TRINITY_DN8517_c0_g1~~TRINITY_DN8517_c0_g1_i1.p1  ORF type:complete len:222 (-),score=26.52 TRINITY_DN8517_c0_g1_i1:168-794(-)